jgi:hypothetical protein
MAAKTGSPEKTALAGTIAKAREVPPAAMPAAVVRKLRRDVAPAMGVFMGGVLSTLSAWVIWIRVLFGSG